MTDYAKLKNAELEALLKERGLPHSGKKADMVARLQSHDSETASVANSAAGTVAPASSAPSAPGTATPIPPGATTVTTTVLAPAPPAEEDKIDWDDDDAAAAPAAAASNSASAPASQPPAEATVVVTTESSVPDPAIPNTNIVVSSSTALPAPAGLTSEQIALELERMQKRAKRFGLEMAPDGDEAKELERLKRFGPLEDEAGAASIVAGLDSALPERTRRSGRDRGRGHRSPRKGPNSRGNRPVHAGADRSTNRSGGQGSSNQPRNSHHGNNNNNNNHANNHRSGNNAGRGRNDGRQGRRDRDGPNRRRDRKRGDPIAPFDASEVDPAKAAARLARFGGPDSAAPAAAAPVA